MNDIGEVRIRTAKPLTYDGYTANRLTGSFVLVNPAPTPPSPPACCIRPRKRISRIHGLSI